MSEHRIRLRGPWEVRSATASNTVATASVVLPTSLRSRGIVASGRVVCVREFGRPKEQPEPECFFLVVAGVPVVTELRLNNHPLGRVDPESVAEFDITRLMRPRNRLEAAMPIDDPDMLIGLDATLVIRPSAPLA